MSSSAAPPTAARAGYWSLPDGDEATIAAIARAVQSHAPILLQVLDEVYTSIDFKTGLDMELLEKHSQLLTRLVELDPRGAIMGQQQMVAGLKAAYSGCGLDDQLRAACLLKAKSSDEILEMQAYKIRCMGSHIREKHDSHKPGTSLPPWLQKLFDMMRKGRQVENHKKSRRQERLWKRPCPFTQYREDEPTNDEVPEEEQQATMVSKCWTGSAAVLLRADGNTERADLYEHGPRGFIVAKMGSTW